MVMPLIQLYTTHYNLSEVNFLLFQYYVFVCKKIYGTQIKPKYAGGAVEKILFMNDDPVILDVVGELIKALGHEAEFSAHGKDDVEKYALAKHLGKPFNAVILDITTRGEIGGAEAVRMLKEIDPGAMAIVSSGYSDNAITSNYREYKFDAFLKKPYNVVILRDVLGGVLNR